MDGKGGKAFITVENLRSVVLAEQRLKGPVGRNQEEQLEFSEVQKLDLGSKHICRIERLWEFTSLTTLHLNNNYIKKMEGLSRLTNLLLLNLSFNNITRIEGLESLKKLEELNLSDNKISVLENMDSLEKLISFNIANNNVEELSNAMYLKKFKDLFSLNFCGNPISKEEDYKLFVAAFFPNVKYLDYRYVNSDTKKEASLKFHIVLQQLHLEDLEREKKAEALKTKQDELQLHTDAFVESLNGSSLFEQMLKNDPQANELQGVPEIAAQLKTFKRKMSELCVQLFETGLAEHKRRQEELNSFYTSHSMTTAEIRQKEALLIAEFEKYFKQIKNEASPTPQTSKVCIDNLNQLQKNLLTQEFQLISQVEMMIKKLDVVITEMVGTFSESAQDIFAQCRDMEDNYHEKVQGIVATTIENVTKDDGVEDLSEDVKMLFLDKDVVAGAITTAHENHLLTIRDRESQLITRTNTWKNRLIKKIQDKELQRNRMALSHINTYVDHYKEEVEKLFNR